MPFIIVWTVCNSGRAQNQAYTQESLAITIIINSLATYRDHEKCVFVWKQSRDLSHWARINVWRKELEEKHRKEDAVSYKKKPVRQFQIVEGTIDSSGTYNHCLSRQ